MRYLNSLVEIASVAGTTFDDPEICEGARLLSVLHIHGTADGIRVELWTIQAGPHVPAFDPDDIGRRLIAWFLE